MSFLPQNKSVNFLVQIIAVVSATLPMLSMTFAQPAAAESNGKHCITVEKVGICAEKKDSGYEFYAQLGPLTSQKQYIGRDGGCATFGTIDILGNHAQVQGCVKRDPARFEGKAEACEKVVGLGKCKTKSFAMSLDRDTASAPQERGTYQLYWDSVRVGTETNWTREQAIANLEYNKKAFPQKHVEGLFNSWRIGYELMSNGVRIGFEPSWNRQQAMDNLEYNKKANPNKKIEGFLNGEKIGYELIADGVRIGFEPSWTVEQAIANLAYNKKANPNKKIVGLFNGRDI
jgi:hypothetical protein